MDRLGREAYFVTKLGLRYSKPRFAHVRFGSKADMCSARAHVRFSPNSDRKSGHRRTRFYVNDAQSLQKSLKRVGDSSV
jgi:hypothetical protein